MLSCAYCLVDESKCYVHIVELMRVNIVMFIM